MSETLNEPGEGLQRKPGGWEGRFRCGPGPRRRVIIAVTHQRDAEARARKMREIVRILVKAGKIADACDYLASSATASSAAAFNGFARAAVELSKGGAIEQGPVTFRDVCEMWLSGMLHMRFPKTVPSQTTETADNSRARIVRHIYPLVGDIAVRNFTQGHYDTVMKALSKRVQCRDKIAGFMVRVLDHSVRLKLVAKNPIDPNTVPPSRAHDAIAFTYLYPDEDERLLRCVVVPLWRRLFYGLIVRNGFRSSEAGALVYGDIDFVNGDITLDQNKTKPRCWHADPDVLAALKLFMPEDAEPGDKVFPWYTRRNLSAQLIRDLKTAGIDRRNLFVRTDKRRPIRVHDLRATFVTLAMACGRNERWVKARTGHTTSIMLSRYERRSGDSVEAGHTQWVVALDEALWPEAGPKSGSKPGQGVGQVLPFQRK